MALPLSQSTLVPALLRAQVLIGMLSFKSGFVRFNMLIPAPSYVILLLAQGDNFSPPSDLSQANIGVSVFNLTDYLSASIFQLSSSRLI